MLSKNYIFSLKDCINIFFISHADSINEDIKSSSKAEEADDEDEHDEL